MLLKSALLVVHAVDRDQRPVLVHCSDGWDRTPQIVALAKLLLDPYYRTVEVSMSEREGRREGRGEQVSASIQDRLRKTFRRVALSVGDWKLGLWKWPLCWDHTPHPELCGWASLSSSLPCSVEHGLDNRY